MGQRAWSTAKLGQCPVVQFFSVLVFWPNAIPDFVSSLTVILNLQEKENCLNDVTVTFVTFLTTFGGKLRGSLPIFAEEPSKQKDRALMAQVIIRLALLLLTLNLARSFLVLPLAVRSETCGHGEDLTLIAQVSIRLALIMLTCSMARSFMALPLAPIAGRTTLLRKLPSRLVEAPRSLRLRGAGARSTVCSSSPTQVLRRSVLALCIIPFKLMLFIDDWFSQTFIDSVNSGYEVVHKAFEAQFWGTKMVLPVK
jgi:hypothetical protein